MRCWFCVAFELQPNATIELEQPPFSKARFRDLAGFTPSETTAECLTKLSLVFGPASLRHDLAMPSRKSETCQHRERLGKNVAALRARRDLTQEKLAENSWREHRYIQNVEAGDNFPRLPTLARLRAVLRCDWNELLAGCDKV